MKINFKKIFSVILAASMILSIFTMSGCMDYELLQQYLDVSGTDTEGWDGTDDTEIEGEGENEDKPDASVSSHEEDDTPALPDGKFREHFTKIKGKGKDNVTVMVYMCGSTLESQNGFGTADIKEMIGADYSDKVNILIETGGTSRWSASSVTENGTNISTKKNQCWKVMEDCITLVGETKSRMAMTEADTLSNFIQFCSKNYPADRYMLILWDHGDGAVGGYGYDEYATDKALTIDALQKALKDGGVKFDFVGFDACLMGMLEVGYVMADYADYFIASEDYEPANGWEYKNWLNMLSENTSVSTEELGERIVKDYVKECGKNDGILSLMDLVYAKYTFNKWCEFAYANEAELLKTDYAWETESTDRFRGTDTRFDWTDLFFYADESHIIDVLAVARTIESEESGPLLNALRNLIVCSYATSSTAYSASYMTGLAIALPYGDKALYSSIKSIFPKCGFNEKYVEFLGKFVSTEAAPNNEEVWNGWDEVWGGWDDLDSWEDFLNYEWGDFGSLNDYLSDYFSQYGLDW